MPSISLPTAVAIGGLATGVAGLGVSAMGAMSSAHAQSANASYQAQVAKNNSIEASQNAEYATQAGQEKAYEASLKGRELAGAATAAEAANGVDVNSGSAADIRTTDRETSALNTQQTVDTAALQAYGYRTQQTSFDAQSGLDTAESSQAMTAGAYSAAGGLLAGASSVGLNYAKLQNVGALSSTPASNASPGDFTSYGNTGLVVS